MKTIALNERAEALYQELAARTGKTESELAELAFAELLETMEDTLDAERAARAAAESGRRIPIEEVRRKSDQLGNGLAD